MPDDLVQPDQPPTVPDTDSLPSLPWHCVICGSSNEPIPVPEREGSPCRQCDSTWRTRAIALTVLEGLGMGSVASVAAAPKDWSRIGIGLDEHESIFATFPTRWRFINTHLEGFPRLDLRSLEPTQRGSAEFVICSDVLEHVLPPASDAAVGLRELLKPQGFAVVSVPTGAFEGETKEWYPDLAKINALSRDEFEWVDGDGDLRRDTHPTFHGGTGLTLEFRVFTDASIRALLESVGFVVAPHPVDPLRGVWPMELAGLYLARRVD